MSLNKEQLRYLNRCIDKNIDLLGNEKDNQVIEKLKSIKEVLNKDEIVLSFSLSSSIFTDVDECLAKLETFCKHYASLADLHLLSEYDVIKKEITVQLEYLATLKDMLNNEVNFNEDVLKKEIKSKVVTLIVEETGCSVSQAEKLVFADKRYSSQLRILRPYMDYAQITKTKYDFYMKMLQSVTQSVSTATKEMNANKLYGAINER